MYTLNRKEGERQHSGACGDGVMYVHNEVNAAKQKNKYLLKAW